MATNKVFASYQEVIDMHTESGHVTAIGIHTPTGDTPRKMFSGFFDMYKRYKYLGCSLSFVPVATLPADPSQVSYEASEPGIDPRDLVNPIMFHGCHGDDMGAILNKLYGDDSVMSDSMDGLDFNGFDWTSVEGPLADSLHRLYYKALTDNTWKKAHPQRGFRKAGLRPLVYSMASNRQIGFGTSPYDAGDIYVQNSGALALAGGDATSDYDETSVSNAVSASGVRIFTPRLTGLGWLDTRNALTSGVLLEVPEEGTTEEKLKSAVTGGFVHQINYAELPKLFMGVILLAPAYKTELYFRVIINHKFAFKDFRGVSFRPEVTGVPSYFDGNDDPFDPETFDDIPFDSGGDTPTPPVPPEPTAFTYRQKTEFTLGSFPATYYDDIQLSGSACNVTYDTNQVCTDLVVYEDALGDTQYYFAKGAATDFYGLLSSNFEVGQTSTVYYIVYGSVSSSASQYVNSCTPSDYVDVIRSGNFTLTQR